MPKLSFSEERTAMVDFVWYLDGGPVLVVVFAGVLAVFFLAAIRPVSALSFAERRPSARPEVATDLLNDTKKGWLKQLHNREYKRWGGVLLLLGFGGFVPSIVKLCLTGRVWSVSHNQPHTDVDGWLVAHMAGAIGWGLFACFQIASGGVGSMLAFHRWSGRIGVFFVVIAMVCGGVIYTSIYDFRAGLGGLAPGLYTLSLALATCANVFLSVYYARQRDLARHKDHALMALMWSLDPGVHRTVMWIMHAACSDCWSEATYANRHALHSTEAERAPCDFRNPAMRHAPRS